MWYEKTIEGLSSPQIINDSKTPSGRVHVGSLRGVLIHDALYRALRDKGVEVRYQYGVDDYDPLDGLPADAGAALRSYMGLPLCNIPAPEGSQATDLADHYIAEFLGVFSELGVEAEIYRMRDVYRSGQFNAAIDHILRKADVVRRVYKEVSNADRPDHWYPFQVVCENCGRIGTTEVSDYDGKHVSYVCKTDLVSWATGCGYRGRISPFDGNGKLPWKLEWVAKWHTFGITVEGAGKDHCTKGGSRDVAARCLQQIFGETPPLNVPYEFFLVSGAKMSSSKGVGVAAREIANFLPPEIVRFLMIRTPPKRTVNFSTDFDYIVKLFNEHDKLVEASLTGRASSAEEKLLTTVEVSPGAVHYHPVGFQLLTALVQLPHIEVEAEIEKRAVGGLSPQDRENLRRRLKAVRYWLDNYASEEDRVELQQALPASATALSETQKAFLHLLGTNFPSDELSEDDYQKFIFDTARLTPIDQKSAFAAIYRVLLDKDSGPKGGSLFSFLDKHFLTARFLEIDYSRDLFWTESAITMEQCQAWFAKQKAKTVMARADMALNAVIPAAGSPDRTVHGQCVIELTVTLTDGKTHRLRVLLRRFDSEAADLESKTDELCSGGEDFLRILEAENGVGFLRAERTQVFQEQAGSASRANRPGDPLLPLARGA